MLIQSRKLLTGLLLAGFVATPVQAQSNLVGYWNSIFHEDFEERVPGPDTADYAGIPINEASRLRADTWQSGLLNVPEHQCKPHPSTYGFRGIGTLRMQEETDPETQQIIAYHTHIQWMEQRRTIWMDGREHPDEYHPHTWGGFSTGRWEGNTLIVYTTHLKQGWLRRNGVFISDEAVHHERFIQHEDGLMTHVSMVVDPVYLTEPFIRTNGYRIAARGQMQPYPCRPAIEIDRPVGEIPHWMMGTPEAEVGPLEFAERWNLPIEAGQGGANTTLPEFMDVVRQYQQQN